MPTITPDIVLLLAADKLVDTIGGIIPKTTVTKDAITQLMAIFRDKAMVASDATSAQRVLRKIAATKRTQAKETHAGSQRVENEADEIRDAVEQTVTNPIYPILKSTHHVETSRFISKPARPNPGGKLHVNLPKPLGKKKVKWLVQPLEPQLSTSTYHRRIKTFQTIAVSE